jgi:uncharacterized protein (DUF927 family)
MITTITTPITTPIDSLTVGSIKTSATTYGTISVPPTAVEDLMERHELNLLTVEHKVTEFELMKLKDTVPTYADEIKENLSRNLAREIIKKTSFTKKRDVDADVHHFIGRVWVFTEDELKKLLEEAKHA